MTDPLSITAAAAGFLGLAGQLAQGVIKLKEMHTTIRDAPKDVANLCSRMETLQVLLEEIGRQIQQSALVGIDIRLFRDVINRCEASRYKVEAHVSNISNSISKSKSSAMKYLFKKKEIQEILSEVEECKSNLVIARQHIDSVITSYRHDELLNRHAGLSHNTNQLLQQTSRVETRIESISSRQRLDFDAISQQVAGTSQRSADDIRSLRDVHRESSSKICESLRYLSNQVGAYHDISLSSPVLARIEDIQQSINTTNSHLETLVCHRAADHGSSTTVSTKRLKVGFQSVLFSFSVEVSTSQEKQQTENRTPACPVTRRICTIRLPNWFAQEQYNLAIGRSINGWLFRPTIYRTVSPDSPLFEACKSGDLKIIRSLLSTKKAFLGDRDDERGSLALDWALYYGHLEVCKLLVGAGILSVYQDDDYLAAIATVMSTLRRGQCGMERGREFIHLIEPIKSAGSGWIEEDLVLTPTNRKAVTDLVLTVEKTGGSALIRFEARLFSLLYTLYQKADASTTALDELSVFLANKEHVAETSAAGTGGSWLLHSLASMVLSLAWGTNSDGVEISNDVVEIVCSCLDVLLNSAGLDPHAPLDHSSTAWNFVTPLSRSSVHSTTPLICILDNDAPSFWDVLRDESHVNIAIRLWILALYRAGVDLNEYAVREVPMAEQVLKRMNLIYVKNVRLLYGPNPDDWELVACPPGEAYLAYFWRNVEEESIIDKLTAQVLDIMLEIEGQQATTCNMPGRWDAYWDSHEPYERTVRDYLTCLEDSEIEQTEIDLDQMTAEQFYEVWGLGYIVEDWKLNIDQVGFIWELGY